MTLVAFETNPDHICLQSQVKYKANTMNEKAIDTGSPFTKLVAVTMSILKLRSVAFFFLFPDSKRVQPPSFNELSNKVISTTAFQKDAGALR